MKTTPASTEWKIAPMVGFRSGRVTGYTVERIHHPYTRFARAEALERGRVFSTHAEAQAAIARATGQA